MSFGYKSMTTITSSKTAELKSFPPITDTVVWIKQVDWADVRQRCRAGVNNVGLVLAVTGEKIHELGSWLAEV
tara:strand:+ start:647 stop:865 length:219 start_codon:yes stop_codon:yes gene_type:complete